MRQRRFLPSLSLLLAFEAVVRNRSVTLAAQELNLTQSTVSRLVGNLEAQLGQPLFVRQRKKLIATEAALTYCKEVTRALDIIQRSSTTLVTNPQGGTLSLAILPTFGTRWLAPRLGRFLSANPGISVNLATRVQRFGFGNARFDAVIFYGDPDWPEAHHQKLFDEHMTACAAPELLARHPIRDLADLELLTLLHLENRPTAWATWFAGQGGSGAHAEGMMMDQFSMMIQATISGLGIALLPDYLARIEIDEGRLLPVLAPGVAGTGAYWLAWPEDRNAFAPLSAFRQWLREETGGVEEG